MRADNIHWVDRDLMSMDNRFLTEEQVLVLNLANFVPESHEFLSALQKKPLRPTMVALGTPEQIENARTEFRDLDITYLDRREGLDEQSALQDIYDQLAAVYQPFARLGIQFARKSAVAEQATAARQNPRTSQEALLAAVFGEHADDVKPIATEIDPAYEKPPFAFDQEQFEQLLTLVNRRQTEERREDD
jgi:hypothetical protein